MIGKIFKQMWYQRKQNGWIFMEMVIISFFLWKAMDPIYILATFSNFDKGYNTENAFALKIETGEDEKSKDDIHKILNGVKLNPMVQEAAVTGIFTYPGSTSMRMSSYKSGKCAEWTYLTIYCGYDNLAQEYLSIIGYRDINTGDAPAINKAVPAGTICYLSKMAASQLFPDNSNPVGQKIWSHRDTLTVAGVINDVTAYFGTYVPAIIKFESFSGITGISYNSAEIILKLKDNANPEEFRKHFTENEMEKLRTENCRITEIRSLEDVYSDARTKMGIDGQTRLQYMLSFFFIACAFLGTAGTIWMKCNRRRSETGLYRAMGSTKKGILKMYFTESAVLVTAAYITALVPLAAIILYNNGFLYSNAIFDLTIDNTAPYLYKRFLPHFGIVTLITYAILMGTAFTGTYITVRKYSNMQPSQALREE